MDHEFTEVPEHDADADGGEYDIKGPPGSACHHKNDKDKIDHNGNQGEGHAQCEENLFHQAEIKVFLPECPDSLHVIN
jgi:hypothetical protein